MSDPTWRPLTPAELPSWARTVAAAGAADRAEHPATLDDLADELTSPEVDPVHDTLAAVTGDGEVLAAGMSTARSLGGPIRRYDLDGVVHPDHRGRGLGRQLLAWQLERAARRHRADRTPVPGWAAAALAEHRDDLRRLLERAGLAPLRWYTRLRRPLDTPIATGPLPAGLRLARFDRTRAEQVRAAHNQAWVDHWGHAPRPADEWRAWTVGHRSFRPDWSFVAVTDADQVVGYVANFGWQQEWQHQGFTEGYTELLGVVRQWRGRGVASALLAAGADAFRADGLQFAGLDVDSDSLTGALRLYRSLGYLPTSRTTLMATRFDPVPPA